MEWSKWYIFSSGIRRYREADGKKTWERYPRAKYKHLTEAELPAFVARLNHRYETQLAAAKAAYELKHLFISQEILDEFEQLLAAEIPNKNVAKSLYTYLRRHCLHWFINQLGVQDPVDWLAHQRTWGLALLCKTTDEQLVIWSKPPHPDTISKHVQVMNRFLRFLHERMPREIPVVVLQPITRAQSRLYKVEYSAGEAPGQFVNETDWAKIEATLCPSIRGFAQLAYYYGLRQSECMAVTLDNLYEDHLEVSEQLVSFTDGEPAFGALKNRAERRKIEHWFSSPKKTYEIISSIPGLMHPDTFYKRWIEEMHRLKMTYRIHDLRRTFITRSFRSAKIPIDIKLAAGHSSIDTTMRYAQDDRDLKRRRYVP